MWFELLILLGLINSVYALKVHLSLGDKAYKPLCDISDNIRCSVALSSQTSELFGFPNPVLGIVFYPVVYGLYVFDSFLALILVGLSLPVFVYLAYELYRLRTFCLVCVFSYVVSIALFFVLL